jgi:hypothetical protein
MWVNAQYSGLGVVRGPSSFQSSRGDRNTIPYAYVYCLQNLLKNSAWQEDAKICPHLIHPFQ